METTRTHREQDSTPQRTFEAPGPGAWQHDPAHWPRPITPWMAEVYPAPFARGFIEGTSRFGLLVSHFDFREVGGYVFYQLVPAQDVDQRIAAAREAFETRAWREDLAEWDNQVRADSIRRNRALQEVDVAALSDSALADHLGTCFDNHVEMVYRHHKYTIPAILPVGDFVARAAEWTGLSNGELLGLLRGASPISNGIAAAELAAAGAALREAGLGPSSFESRIGAACVVERLRNAPGRVGETVRSYLEACGTHVASGYDVTDTTAAEMHETTLEALWSARDGVASRTDESAEALRLEAVRARVPAEHRATFDALLAEARLVNHLRDERGVYNDLWAAGIARRAILEAGRRLAVRGRIEEPELVFEATAGEMRALLEGRSGPSSAELELRAAARRPLPADAVPLWLGDPPPAPPALDELPEHARVAARAIAVAVEEILSSAAEPHGESSLVGKPVSPGVYEGRARVVASPSDFDKLRRGDVLVTASTNAAFNVVLPLLGAIVTDRGGLLTHAAIVAREYGIPAVVGTRDATRNVPDGARVRVDGTRGSVEVLR